MFIFIPDLEMKSPNLPPSTLPTLQIVIDELKKKKIVDDLNCSVVDRWSTRSCRLNLHQMVMSNGVVIAAFASSRSSIRVSTQQATSCELEPWGDLRGTIVMVTGAFSGIGCIDLAKAGCRINAAARRTDRLKALCDVISNLNITGTHRSQGRDNDVQAVAMELDVSADGPTIKAYVLKAWDAFGIIRGNFEFS
ncbi:unnamed protein product [Lactuca virosa]|uniref:Uncharacterized protein n=1 Tax=Lactuca virosa TaxID=75947 RepID=A0AAU9LCD2_9ASTR|nr:unnamed protein product [Lactuca virosa]